MESKATCPPETMLDSQPETTLDSLPAMTLDSQPPTMLALPPVTTLDSLPFEVLHEVWLHVASGCHCSTLALAACNHSFAASLSSPDTDRTVWAAAARSMRIPCPAPSLSHRQTVQAVGALEHTLRPFLTHPPPPASLGTPRRLRCPRDPASASSAFKLRASDSHYATGASKHSTGMAGASRADERLFEPFGPRERQWLGWFSRVHEGTLHVENVAVGQPSGAGQCQAVHLHSPEGDCLACVLQSAVGCSLGASAVPSGIVTAGPPLDGRARLLGAVTEFRHRLAVARALHVLCDAPAAGRRARAALEAMPASMCVHLRSLAQIDSWIEGIYPVDRGADWAQRAFWREPAPTVVSVAVDEVRRSTQPSVFV